MAVAEDRVIVSGARALRSLVHTVDEQRLDFHNQGQRNRVRRQSFQEKGQQ
jgi:hypothetical protein